MRSAASSSRAWTLVCIFGVLFPVACVPSEGGSVSFDAGFTGSGSNTGSGGVVASGGTTVGPGTGGSSSGQSGGSSGTGGASATGGDRGSGGAQSGTGGVTTGETGGRGGTSTGGSSVGGRGAGGATTAGSGGSSGATASGGTTGYSPCPAAGTACVILPFGDSITYGYGTTDLGGYRSLVFGHAVADNKSLTFVGSSADGPQTVSGKPFPRNHEGHASYTIDGSKGITPLVDQGIITRFKPNIVLLMIGTNDMSQAIDLGNAPTRLGKLIDKILVGAPNALIVIAKITPSQKEPANTYTQTYNAALPAVAQTRVSQGKHVVLVDMYSPFVADSNWKKDLMTDSVHPNDAGYKIMGDVWYAAIKDVLR